MQFGDCRSEGHFNEQTAHGQNSCPVKPVFLQIRMISKEAGKS
jgi:hypothetical protein